MKKYVLMAVLFMSTIIANAQTAIQTTKWYDNISVGITGGVTTPLDFNSVFPVNPVAGLKLQKDFTPKFGLQVEGIAVLNDNHFTFNKNTVKATNVGLNGVINLSNLFCGYKGKPRVFEISTVTGLGWLYYWNTDNHFMSAKTGLDFTFNLGKGHSLALNPAVYWNLNNWKEIKFDKRNAQLALMASYVYHFKTSNGTHSFKVYDIAALNDEINNLRNELDKKPKEIIRTETKETITERLIEKTYVVMFAKGSSELIESSIDILNSIPTDKKVKIVATASPEGTPEFNNTLSKMRANAVRQYLTARGVKVTEAVGIGVQGDSSNRVAIVTVQ